MFKKKIKNIFDIILFIKKSEKKWNFPKRKDILVYDGTNFNILESYIKNYSFYILFKRGEEVNIPCIFLSIFKISFWLLNFSKAYEDTIIDFVKPKIAITFMDNNPGFFRLSNDHAQLTSILIQNGWRNGNDQIFLNNQKNKFKVDYMFVFNMNIAEKFENFIQGQTKIIGSLKNNHFSSIANKSSSVNDCILYISSYRGNNGNIMFYDDHGNPKYWNDLFKYDVALLYWLADWSIKNKKKIIICPRYADDNNGEFSWYEKIFKNKKLVWEIFTKNNQDSSYQALEKAKIIISTPSTLGYEAFGRGKRTAFFICRGELINVKGFKFGWPKQFDDTGPFWSNRPNENEFVRIMDFLNSISDKDWLKICSSYKNEIINYEPGNPQIRDLLDNLATKNNMEKKIPL